MARAKKPPIHEKPPFSIHTFTLTPDVVEGLQRLSQEATDFLGRSISSSAIVRALVRHMDDQGAPAVAALLRVVEQELKAGVKWGKQS
jgi:hypothetical protein